MLLADAWAGGTDLRNPWVSPFYSQQLHCLPPILVQLGGAEMLHDQILQFVAKAVAAGVDVTLEVAPEMPHVFQLFAFVGSGACVGQ